MDQDSQGYLTYYSPVSVPTMEVTTRNYIRKVVASHGVIFFCCLWKGHSVRVLTLGKV